MYTELINLLKYEMCSPSLRVKLTCEGYMETTSLVTMFFIVLFTLNLVIGLDKTQTFTHTCLHVLVQFPSIIFFIKSSF